MTKVDTGRRRWVEAAREKGRADMPLCPSRVFFILFPAEGIKQIITNSKNCVFVCCSERRNSPALKR